MSQFSPVPPSLPPRSQAPKSSTDVTATGPPPLPPRAQTTGEGGRLRGDRTSSLLTVDSDSESSAPIALPDNGQATDILPKHLPPPRRLASTTSSAPAPVTVTDSELLKLYEDAEIGRFLSLFSNYVTGVTAIPSSSNSTPTSQSAPIVLPPDISRITAFILRRFIPRLPKQPVPFSQSPTEAFTLSKLQVNATRLYIFFPEYAKFIGGIVSLALWKEWGRSARYCAVYWLLWTFDLLLPSIFVILLYTILRGRFFSNASLPDLRERIAAQQEAEQFGRAAGMNLGSLTGDLGGTEMLGFRMAWNAWRNSKVKRKVVQEVNAEDEADAIADAVDEDEDGGTSEAESEVIVAVKDADEEATPVTAASDSLPSPLSATASTTSLDSTLSTATDSTAMSLDSTLTISTKERKRAEQERLKALKRATREEAKRHKAEAKAKEKERKAAEKQKQTESKEQEQKRKVEDKERIKKERIEEEEKRREEDWRKKVMVVIGDLADLHERVRNMFLWRDPAASRVFTAVFAGLALFTLVTPTRYIVKLILAGAGAAFWFLVPVLNAMPDKDRARMPPPFSNVPTDAQYAFALIKERAARGESVAPSLDDPAALRALQMKEGERRVSLEDVGSGEYVDGLDAEGSEEGEEKPKGWEKWVEKGRRTWVWAEEGRRVLNSEPTLASLVAGADVSSFPAQFASSLGTLHITTQELWFTPITLSTPTRRIPLASIAGVEKVSSMAAGWGVGFAAVIGGAKWGGLEVRLRHDDKEEQEVLKLPWVGKRDQAFALVLAYSEQSWLRT